MGHYDSSRPGYCGGCGAAPGNIRKDGTCNICIPDAQYFSLNQTSLATVLKTSNSKTTVSSNAGRTSMNKPKPTKRTSSTSKKSPMSQSTNGIQFLNDNQEVKYLDLKDLAQGKTAVDDDGFVWMRLESGAIDHPDRDGEGDEIIAVNLYNGEFTTNDALQVRPVSIKTINYTLI